MFSRPFGGSKASKNQSKGGLIALYLDSVNTRGGNVKQLRDQQTIRKNRGYSYIRQRDRRS